VGLFTRQHKLTASVPVLSTTTAGYLSPVTIPEIPELALSREGAWRVPAVAQGLQVIAGTVGTFPLRRYNSNNEAVPYGLTEQLDPLESTSTTITKLVEDLVLWPAAYLVTIARYADGYPANLRYVPYEDVSTPDYDGGPYHVLDQEIPARDMVVIPAHWPGLIQTGGRAIRTALVLEAAVSRIASTDLPTGIIYDDGPDLDPDKVSELLTSWENGRRRRTTGYLNRRFRYERESWNSEELALVPSRDHQVAELARLMNVPTRYLNAPTNSSLTYSTVEGQRRDLVDTTLRPYLVAIESRLTLTDVTPRGHRVRFALDDFLRSDTAGRYEAYTKGLAAGFLTLDEVRRLENLPTLPGVAR
jgi:phage portal protein BeeE